MRMTGRDTGAGEAAALIEGYKRDGITAIIRDGTEASCPYGAGDIGILREFRGCVLTARITAVRYATYQGVTDKEWRAAGHADAKEAMDLIREVEIPPSAPVCILTLDPSSFRVRPKARRYGGPLPK